jgi:hypothetical protein
MTTTYTTGGGIKKIGTGLEAGTWGGSTNENWERVVAMVGGSKSINIDAMPLGSVDASLDGTTSAELVTLDASDEGQNGSEGRSFVLDVNSVGTMTGAATLEIWGTDLSTKVNRVMLIKNSIATALTVQSGDTNTDTVTIPPGEFMLVLIRSSTIGAFNIGTHNLLNSITVDKIAFATGATGIDFTAGTGTIEIPGGEASAFDLTDGTDSYIRINTSNGNIVFGGKSSKTILDLSDGMVGDADVTIDDNSTTALVFKDATLQDDILALDSTTNDKKVIIGETGGTPDKSVDLILYGNVDVSSGATTATITDNNASSLLFQTASATDILTLDTTTGTEKVLVANGVELHAPDISLVGTDGYILGTPNATPANGYGFRNDSATSTAMQVKHPGAGGWESIAQFAIAGQVDAAADAGGGGGPGINRQGSFDIGPYRFIYNTFLLTLNPETVVLGTGNGTSATMNSALYTVIACPAEHATSATSLSAYVTVSAAAGEFVIQYIAGIDMTYLSKLRTARGTTPIT